MRQLQRFFATALLIFTLAFSAAAHGGIIHTGCTEPVPPPPATGSSVAEEPAEGETAMAETVVAETTAVDAVLEAALGCLSNVLALY